MRAPGTYEVVITITGPADERAVAQTLTTTRPMSDADIHRGAAMWLWVPPGARVSYAIV
jgi:hypothetical protein